MHKLALQVWGFPLICRNIYAQDLNKNKISTNKSLLRHLSLINNSN